MLTQLWHRTIGFSLLALALSLTVYASTALGSSGCHAACLANYLNCVNSLQLATGGTYYQQAIFTLDCQDEYEACLGGC